MGERGVESGCGCAVDARKRWRGTTGWCCRQAEGGQADKAESSGPGTLL